MGGSERTMVEVGFGGATGAKDVVSARIAQRTKFRTMVIDRVLAIGELLWSALLMGALSVALLSSTTTLGVEAPMQNHCKNTKYHHR